MKTSSLLRIVAVVTAAVALFVCAACERQSAAVTAPQYVAKEVKAEKEAAAAAAEQRSATADETAPTFFPGQKVD